LSSVFYHIDIAAMQGHRIDAFVPTIPSWDRRGGVLRLALNAVDGNL